MHDRRDIWAACGLCGLGIAVLAIAFVAIVYLAMVGIAECADPWTGCRTVIGVGR